jgi:NitT/TauT family transport system permease protein
VTTSTLRLASIAALLAFWFLLAAVFSATVVPGPAAVFAKMWENLASGQAPYHIFKTLLRVFLGLILTMILGAAAGTLMGLFRKGEAFLESWVTVGLTIPAIVYSIICLLWFGFNDFGAVVAIGVSAFPTVAISVWQGIKGLDTQLVDMGAAFHLSRPGIVRKIVFPQLLPHLLASMRYALGICWKICTTVELIGLSSGVGYMLNYWFGLFSMTQVFAWTLSFLLVMFAIEYLLFKPVETRLTRWRTSEVQSRAWLP